MPDASDGHVAFDPLLEVPSPGFAGQLVPARAQAGDGRARLGEDFDAACAVVRLTPADGGGAFELERPVQRSFIQRSQLVERGVADPGMAARRTQHLGDGEVNAAQADRWPAAPEQMLHEDAKEAVVEQAQAQPAFLARVDMDALIGRILPVAVERRQRKILAILRVVHLRGQCRIDGLDGGVEGGMGQLAGAAGQGARVQGGQFDDKGVE